MGGQHETSTPLGDGRRRHARDLGPVGRGRRAGRLRSRSPRSDSDPARDDAERRARDYADALDLGPVRVLSISDSGLGGPVQRKVILAAAAAPGAESGALSLRPGEVDVTAEVEADFTVSAGD